MDLPRGSHLTRLRTALAFLYPESRLVETRAHNLSVTLDENRYHFRYYSSVVCYTIISNYKTTFIAKKKKLNQTKLKV